MPKMQADVESLSGPESSHGNVVLEYSAIALEPKAERVYVSYIVNGNFKEKKKVNPLLRSATISLALPLIHSHYPLTHPPIRTYTYISPTSTTTSRHVTPPRHPNQIKSNSHRKPSTPSRAPSIPRPRGLRRSYIRHDHRQRNHNTRIHPRGHLHLVLVPHLPVLLVDAPYHHARGHLDHGGTHINGGVVLELELDGLLFFIGAAAGVVRESQHRVAAVDEAFGAVRFGAEELAVGASGGGGGGAGGRVPVAPGIFADFEEGLAGRVEEGLLVVRGEILGGEGEQGGVCVVVGDGVVGAAEGGAFHGEGEGGAGEEGGEDSEAGLGDGLEVGHFGGCVGGELGCLIKQGRG